ncbi:conjugal transfer protein [Saccharolobus islandicus]|uniref:conjugal transfer protein n=1 Tax=Saccharolobus islandicus TaxID=43080 RepID=UPI003D7E8A5B
MGKEIEIPFINAEGYSVPLIKVRMECPKSGEDVLIYALPDSGSRFSLINRRTLNECFDNLEDHYFDIIILTNLNLHAKRYKLKFHFVELNENFEIPVAIADFGVYEGVFPSLILGREDFFSKTMICFDRDIRLIIKADSL